METEIENQARSYDREDEISYRRCNSSPRGGRKLQQRERERGTDVDDIMKVQQWKLRSFNFIYSLAPPSTELTDC